MSQSPTFGTSHLLMASRFSKAKVAKVQQTKATQPALATPFGMTTTSLPLTVPLLTHLSLPSQLLARPQRSSAHSLDLVIHDHAALEAFSSCLATLKPRLVLQFFFLHMG